jgi:hypothetical protein
MRLIFGTAIVAALALSGCGGGTSTEPNATATANNTAVENAIAPADDVGVKMAALPEGLRNGTLLRGIMDLHQPCEGVASSTRLSDQDGHPRWRADCKGLNPPSYVVVVPPDGMLQITGPYALGKPTE